jgi:hypothetical protein
LVPGGKTANLELPDRSIGPVRAKSERVAAWYASYDAVPLADKPLTLVMALATFETDLKAGGHL